ncbi:hypothetical protein JG687_00018425, partial [Phytophthora cactorum]
CDDQTQRVPPVEEEGSARRVNTPGEGTPSHAVPYFCERGWDLDPRPVRR